MKKAAKLSFSSDKNCFISLPQSWTAQLARDKVHVFELTGKDGGGLFTTWSGNIAPDNAAGPEVHINGLYASKHQFQQEEEVLVTLTTDVPACSHVFVEPVSVDDWEILELHASYVESNLLQQVRVVSHGQVMPIWLTKSICVFLTIGAMEPSAKCCLLQENTEVIISPKGRRPEWKPNTPGETTKALNGPDSTKPQHSQEEAIGKTANSNSQTSDSNLPTSDSNLPMSDSNVQSNDSNAEEKGVLTKTLDYLKSWIIPDDTKAIEKEITEPEVSYLDNANTCSLRIQPFGKIINRPSDDLTETCPFESVLEQSTNVFISQQTLEKSFGMKTGPEKIQSFLACISRLLSPKEKEDLMKQRMEKQNKAKLSNSAADKIKELEEDTTVIKFPVRVFIWYPRRSNNGNDKDDDSDSNPTIQFKDDPGVLPHHVMVHDLLRKQLGLEVTGRVKVEVVPESCQPMKVKAVEAHPLFAAPSGFMPSMLKLAVEEWLRSHTSSKYPLVAGQGTMINVSLKPDFQGEFMLAFPSLDQPQTSLDSSPPFCLLVPGMNISVCQQLSNETKPPAIHRLPFWTVKQIDPKVPDVTKDQLGGISKLLSCALSHLRTSLGTSPLGSVLPSTSGGLLLSGPRGAGKTSLGQLLLRELAHDPAVRAYTALVDCKTYRGKQVSSVRRHLERILSECVWRQPAVLLMDDLDIMAAALTGPEHENSPEARYHTQVAQVLKDLLKQLSRQGSNRIVLVATCRNRNNVHSSLSGSHGNHFFSKTLHIKPPNKSERASILQTILQEHVSPACLDDLDLDAVAKVTEGHVARDLVTVIERAVHVHRMTSSSKSRDGDIVTNSDLSTALHGFSPASLRDVPLHQASDMTWEDVGGLHAVRHTLVETLMWPAKYPALFTACPLRLRSGLLLYGAPGTGKTLLAGVLAKECGLNFISIKGPELLSKYIGASEESVRATFERAQAAKPCVLFFDEFDSLAPRRGHDSTGVTDRVVNQLLTQLDGVEGLDGVYVLAATSRPDLIDPALVRPGRLDKALLCTMPDAQEREQILKALSRRLHLASDVDLHGVADRTENFTGADLKAMLYNAQLEAVHEVTGTVGVGGSSKAVKSATSNGSWEKVAITDKESWQQVDDEERQPEQAVQIVAEKALVKKSSSQQERNIAYIPSLEEGVVDLTVEAEDELRMQVERLLGNSNHGNHSNSGKPGVTIVITQQHIETALKDMQPSVTEVERRKYDFIYENFISSKGGNFGIQAAGKRATLA